MHDSEITSSSIAIVPALTQKSLQAMANVLAILVVGLVALAAIYLRQDRMRYFPAPATVAEVVARTRLQAWPSAQDFRGLVAEPAGAVRGTAVVFHGNAGRVGDLGFHVRALTPMGSRVSVAAAPTPALRALREAWA